MPDEPDEMLNAAQAALEACGKWNKTCDDLLKFRELAKRSESAWSVLVELTSHEDLTVRFLAAEALSCVHAEAKHAIPILVGVLDAYAEQGYPAEGEIFPRIALDSLVNYSTSAVAAESSVWPYLHCQTDLRLRMYAAVVVLAMSEVSTASWTIMCLLCSHEDETLREFCRDVVKKRCDQRRAQSEDTADAPGRYELRVNGKELRKALKQLTLVRKRKGKSEFMVLSFADGVLSFSMDKITSGASAEGTWPGEVVALAASIYGLARVPPKSETVRVTLEGDRLRIGSSVMTVEWMPGADL